MLSLLLRTELTMPRRLSFMAPSAVSIWPNSSLPAVMGSVRRSPPAMRSAMASACRAERVVLRLTSSKIQKASAAMATAMAVVVISSWRTSRLRAATSSDITSVALRSRSICTSICAVMVRR